MDFIDPDDARPAYAQIAAHIRRQVLSGQLAAGDQLLSQPELAQRYGVARETIKRALQSLTLEGLIVSRQGSGTFVREESELSENTRVLMAGYQLAIDDLHWGIRQLTATPSD